MHQGMQERPETMPPPHSDHVLYNDPTRQENSSESPHAPREIQTRRRRRPSAARRAMIRARRRRQQQINRTEIITNDPDIRLIQRCQITGIEPHAREIHAVHPSSDRPNVKPSDDLDTGSRRTERTAAGAAE
jgi:hypothetical protein